MQKEKILIVDDSEMNRSILADMLGDEYDIIEAEDGVQALSALREQRGGIALMLLDIVMPRLDGFGVLEAMNKSGIILEVPVIMISSESSSQQVARAYDMGVSDFIPRPFDALIVCRRVVNTLLLYANQKRLAAMVEEQIFETERRSSMMIEILSQVVEFRNGEGGSHIINVRLITELLLRELMHKTDRYVLTSADISRISIGSALHDIGKILIDENILNKPGRLTPEEFEVVKTHTVRGAEMLDSLPVYRNDPLVRTAYEICRWHHERYDGRGYPDGLHGDEIPISAQVVALADVYDALVSPRVYKGPYTHEETISMIVAGQCGTFNPLLLECLTENAELIRNELADGSARSVTRREIRNIVDESVRTYSGGASDRTLRLLDYERMKHSFFSAMTREIQFEYTVSPLMLHIPTWGAETLGVDEIIMEPAHDPKLCEVFGDGGWETMIEKLDATTPDAPYTSHDCLLTYGGRTRWHRVHIQAIWSPDQPPVLEGALGKVIDIHDTHEKLRELEQMAARDPLTGLLNRNAAADQINARMSERPDSHYALLFLDLDHFKEANDTYGHQFGDEVLKELAKRMLHSVRSSDVLCRFGGDEFLIFLEYNTDIERTVDRIFHSIYGKYKDFTISISMGVALSDIVGRSYGALFRAADAAAYVSKRDGKGCYRFHDENTAAENPERRYD